MKFKELKAMSSQQREKKLREAKFELSKLQAQVLAGTPPKNPGQIQQLKKVIAQYHTVNTQEKRTA
ncbi:MAG: 50S ribosomal protein L29 [Nanoarchaeota archaeon]